MADESRAPEDELQRLQELRLALLRLHKALLEIERLRFERDFGRVPNGFAFLKLVVNDPAFAWLRPLSALIVEFDEQLDEDDEPLTIAAARRLREEARVLTTPEKGGSEYAHNYDRAIQESPEVLLLHRAVVRALAGLAG